MPANWELERLEPRHGRGERFVLDPARAVYAVGRSEACPIRLYSPTASREHAEITLDAEGRWWLTLLEARTGLADGVGIDAPIEVCEGLSLELGGDRFRCQRQRDDATQPGLDVPDAPLVAGRRGIVFWLIAIAVGLIGAGIMLLGRAS